MYSLPYIYILVLMYIHLYCHTSICLYWHNPFRQVFFMHGKSCVFSKTPRNCPGAKMLFTPEQQGREVEHSSGALWTTPHTTDAAHFPGCHQKVRLVLFLRSRTLSMLHWENEAYFLPLPHGPIRPLGKSTASYIFVYIYIAVLSYYCIVVYQYCHITLYIYCLQ